MTKQSPSFDDLVFEGRNKAYGAYELRQLIGRHNAYGLFITGSAFLAIVLLAAVFRSEPVPTIISCPMGVDVKLSDLSDILPERPKQVQHTLPPSPPVATTAFREFNPTANEVAATTDAPRQQDLIDQHIGTETIVSNTPYTAPVEPGPELAYAGVSAGTETPAVSDPVDWAPVMPSFVGGVQALKAYMAKNITMAQSDIENNVSGKVWVRFYVDVDGTVKGVTVIKDTAGGQCAERTLNAIRQMPKWNPGKQNNVPVKVYYSLPVVFEIKDMN